MYTHDRIYGHFSHRLVAAHPLLQSYTHNIFILSQSLVLIIFVLALKQFWNKMFSIYVSLILILKELKMPVQHPLILL